LSPTLRIRSSSNGANVSTKLPAGLGVFRRIQARKHEVQENAKTQKTIEIGLNPNPKGNRKPIGGAAHDEWNDRLTTIVAAAVPINREKVEQCSEAATAVFSGIFDIRPADPIEGILVGQLMVAHEAALSLYWRAWQQPAEYFEARTKYLALDGADDRRSPVIGVRSKGASATASVSAIPGTIAAIRRQLPARC
jgi:hypothetical protein